MFFIDSLLKLLFIIYYSILKKQAIHIKEKIPTLADTIVSNKGRYYGIYYAI